MPSINISEAAVIPAPSAVVYDIIVDYNTGHPSILPLRVPRISTALAGPDVLAVLVRLTVSRYNISRDTVVRRHGD
ncbi:MAG TPA: hypothetical protein VIK50_01385 [Gemmatimonadaceae bacterium]